MKSNLLLLLLCAVMSAGHSQSFTARIVDAENGQPIPFATVVMGAQRGTISNEEGYFSLDRAELQGRAVQVSCMGFESQEIDLELLGNPAVIRLQPAPINLNEVYLNNRIPEAEEIIREVRANLGTNHPSVQQEYQFFYRESSYMHFDQLDLELDKASDLKKEELERARQELTEFSDFIEQSRAIKFLDFNGQFHREKDTSLLRVDRATELVDARQDFSMEKLQDRAQKIILSHLDSTKTYKVKTGMFKVEDSISMKEEFGDMEEDSDSVDVSYLKGMVSEAHGISQMSEGRRVYGFLDMDTYRYTLIKPTYFDGHYVYAVEFRPGKRKAKFSGTLYIDVASYAILKTDYQYAEGREGEKFNLKLLLGIKYVENMDRGTVIFKQSDDGVYHPYYIQKEYGNYVYLHRNLKFIENSASGKKVQFDFLLEGGIREKENLLLRPLSPSSREVVDSDGAKRILVQKLDQYEPTIWQDTEIIAPLEEMKNFRVTN